MRTIKVNLYKFKELGKEVKEKVLEKHRDWNVDGDWWYECVYESWKEKLNKIGFEDAEIAFSGFWCQGDGACFNANCNIRKLLIKSKYPKALVNLLMESDLSASIVTTDHHYSHGNTRDFQLSYYYTDSFLNVLKTPTADLPLIIGEALDEDAKKLYELRVKEQIAPIDLDQVEKDLEEKRLNLCRDIYKDLEKEYNSQTTDEAVIESLEANEKEFTKEGDDA